MESGRPVIPAQTSGRSRFTSTPVPRYAGRSSWDQYRHVFEAIVCSNGWDEVMAALQLVAHLEGDALNVALLVPESQLVLSGVLVGPLLEHYGSLGRLAEYRHQFERVSWIPFKLYLKIIAGTLRLGLVLEYLSGGGSFGCVAHMSCLPEFPDINGQKCFDDLGKNCIMDFSACGTLAPV